MPGELTGRAKLTAIILRAIEVWFVMSVLEIFHGVARSVFLQPFVGDLPARQIGVLTGSLLVILTAYLFRRWINAHQISERLTVGLIWVLLTVGFELVLGRLVLHLSWQRIWSDYDIPHGGFMPFGLLVMLLAPMLTARRGHSNAPVRSVE